MSSWILAGVFSMTEFLGVLLPYFIPLSLLTAVVFLCLVSFPINWSKDLTDVGYNYVGRKRNQKKIDRVMRSRKIGTLPPVYPNGWFMLAESEEIAPGSVKHVSSLGENFAVFRTTKGICYVLDAYCPHNGANMGVGGRVVGDCLECPFHHWQFNGSDGRCFDVPYAKKVPAFAQVKHWPSCEVNGFIFVWYHAENIEPSWFLTNNEQIQSKQFKYHGRNEFIINCHIQEVPENGGDLSHFNAVHKEAMLNGSDLRFHNRILFQFLKHEWRAEWYPSKEEGSKHIGLCKLTHKMILFDKFVLSPCNLDIRQIGPGYVELVINTNFGPMILLQTVTPLEPLLQKVVHRIYCPPALRIYATFIMIAESIMIERDIMVWNHKKYVTNPLLVSEDQTLLTHRRWFNQFYSDNSPRYQFKTNDCDW